MRNYAGTCKNICSYNLVCNFLIQLLPLKSLVFEVHFLNVFWRETFPKGSSQFKFVPLLVVFHLPYSKYKDVKICFYPCRYQNQIFFSRVALVLFVQHSCCSCLTCVALMLHLCHSCRTRVACVWPSRCILDQILSRWCLFEQFPLPLCS